MTYQKSREFVRLHAELPRRVGGTGGVPDDEENRRTLFVVDRSGSMAGSPYRQVLDAIRFMIDSAMARQNLPDFLLYNHEVELVTAENVLESRTGGMTCFTRALRAIQEYISELPGDFTVAVVFMTDGDETVSRARDLDAEFQRFRFFVKSCQRTIVIHTIGFGRDHKEEFLHRLRNLGSTVGCYRYAEGNDLNVRFSELFDFLEVTTVTPVRIGGRTLHVEADREGTELVYDLWLRVEDVDPDNSIFNGNDVPVVFNDTVVTLVSEEADVFFKLRELENTEITDNEALQRVQRALADVNIFRVPKRQREKALIVRTAVQDKLNAYHHLFSEISRGLLPPGSVGARLQSLRYETKFSKARRQRVLDIRAAANAKRVKQIEAELSKLDVDLASFEGMDMSCALSGDTIQDIMRDSTRDIMVFPLRVARPEHAIDAPSQIVINQFLTGHYSFEALQDAMTHAISMLGPERAHGGFTSASELDDNVGAFRGADGSFMNGCLPMFINEEHWQRVECQIEPLLGYFFTLDPLGFKGDQYLAVFGVLGQMIACHRQQRLIGEWADSLINDFSEVCRRLRPKALEYLAAGFYAQGKLRTDPLEAFMESPKYRTKEIIQNLHIIVGLHHLASLSDAQQQRFEVAFVEEVWRRSLGIFYKQSPREVVLENLEHLIYGAEVADGSVCGNEEGSSSTETASIGSSIDERIVWNAAGADKAFAVWGKYKMEALSKRQSKQVAAQWGDSGPELDDADLIEGQEFKPRPLVVFEDQEEFLTRVVQEQLQNISKMIQGMEGLFPTTFTPRQQWLICTQALQFYSNDAVNTAIEHGHYHNTFEHIDDPQLLMRDIHLEFEGRRREGWEARLQEKAAMRTARRILVTKDLWAFIGRLVKSCPTRGGIVFDHLIALLAQGNVEGTLIPLLPQKVRAVFTGRVPQVEGAEEELCVMARGESWVHCPLEVARRFQETLGDEEFCKIECAMYGRWGWVYRESDIPNRHGHCNSNPNPNLTRVFDGFHVSTK